MSKIYNVSRCWSMKNGNVNLVQLMRCIILQAIAVKCSVGDFLMLGLCKWVGQYPLKGFLNLKRYQYVAC